MDGDLSKIFILSLSPEHKPAPHILFMSTVSQVLSASGRPERILAARTPKELFEAFVAPVTAAQSPCAKPARFELGDYVTPDVVVPYLKAQTRDEVIDELLDVLDTANLLPNREAVREAILERENQMPTGLQDGVAIPHARTDTVERLVCAVGVQRDGIDFAALDNQPSRIFILVVTPASGGAGPYLQFAGAIMSILDSSGRQRILDADSQAALHRAITTRLD
jgi:mannitol/fructose-specific phosphotransferase system IIA component (Ntr-type)